MSPAPLETGPLEVVSLTRSQLDRYIGDLVRLDAAAKRELGEAYSEEEWGEQAFALDMPGKWSHSALALANHRVLGFWISSVKPSSTLHTHRVAVSRASRGSGAGRALFEFVKERALTGGIERLTLNVGTENFLAQRFYEGLGFQRSQQPNVSTGSFFYVMDLVQTKEGAS